MSPPGPSVLVVEDDVELSGMLSRLLTDEGYEVHRAYDGQRGLHLALTRPFDVVVLDRGLPGMPGLDLLARIRSRGVTAPVLVLSAQSLARDRVEGLDAGAEDYVTKPFDVEELLARLRALLRRHADRADTLAVPSGVLDVAGRQVIRDGERLTLSGREAALLSVLARHPRQVFSRADLIDLAFPGAENHGVVDTYVHYLRRKLGKQVVETVHGLGYRLGPS